jgi:peptide/nickel transport system substrate-binding protein
VQFSNGDPFTADDVVFTFEFIMNPAIDAPRQRVGYDLLKSIEKVNDFEVIFHFKKPYFESFGLAASISPLSKKFYSQYTPKQFNESVGLLIGTGPYRLRDPAGWHPGEPLQLVRNEQYWGMPGPFDRLLWHEVEEDAAALAMFRNGEVDTFGANPTQYVTMVKDPEVLAKADTYRYYARDGGYSYVAWNQARAGKPTRFADKRLRQAMTLLTDRNRMAADIFRGFAKPAPGPFGVASKQNDPNIKPWPYDPKRALELLAEAGYKEKNKDGLLLGPDGQPFRFKLTYNSKNPVGEQMVLQLKDSLARVGIVLEQEPTDWPIMVKKLDTRDFDAITLGWTGGIETDIFQMFSSTKIADGGDNFMSYRNVELDKLMDQARTMPDEEKRMEVWRKCHQILHEDQPYTFLLYRESTMFIDKRFKNVHQTRSGLNYLSDDVMPLPWYVPANQQKRK